MKMATMMLLKSFETKPAYIRRKHKRLCERSKRISREKGGMFRAIKKGMALS